MNDDSIQSLGGKARARALTDEQRKQIALKGSAARWSDRPIEASHKGNFITEFGVDIDCYVLNDFQKTAVISQRGMGRALGLSSGGSRLPNFLATKAIGPLVGAELAEKLANPLKFQWEARGHEQPPGIIHGFDVSLLIDVCRIIIQARTEGKLGKRHENIVKQAHVILNASAKLGIKQLVYALAGYNPTTQEVISAFKAFVQEEARKYEKEFPPDLYEQWQRLYQIQVPSHGKPWNFKHLTVKHIYFPLAKSNGRILQLLRALKSKGGERQKKLFQFLSELGTRALRIHMGRVLEMAESSSNSITYERKIGERFGGQQELDLVLPPAK
jgi:hypothetical protein